MEQGAQRKAQTNTDQLQRTSPSQAIKMADQRSQTPAGTVVRCQAALLVVRRMAACRFGLAFALGAGRSPAENEEYSDVPILRSLLGLFACWLRTVRYAAAW